MPMVSREDILVVGWANFRPELCITQQPIMPRASYKRRRELKPNCNHVNGLKGRGTRQYYRSDNKESAIVRWDSEMPIRVTG